MLMLVDVEVVEVVEVVDTLVMLVLVDVEVVEVVVVVVEAVEVIGSTVTSTVRLPGPASSSEALTRVTLAPLK
ncbi:MAG: hypothetical protein MGAcid_00230 [uncultured Acidilobus sp. MG]|jgi:hypothetical protein|nr:MAG: hypothetical protein MGAcid_00230 [uncultured Acidilobus sp. MG]